MNLTDYCIQQLLNIHSADGIFSKTENLLRHKASLTYMTFEITPYSLSSHSAIKLGVKSKGSFRKCKPLPFE